MALSHVVRISSVRIHYIKSLSACKNVGPVYCTVSLGYCHGAEMYIIFTYIPSSQCQLLIESDCPVSRMSNEWHIAIFLKPTPFFHGTGKRVAGLRQHIACVLWHFVALWAR